MPQSGDSKSVSFFQIFEALKRRKRFIVIPAILITAGVVFYAYKLPAKYRSSAFLAADPVVSSQLVKAAGPQYTSPEYVTTARTQEQMRLIREALYSPAVLEKLNSEFKLVAAGPDGKLSDNAASDLENRIKVELEGSSAFRLTYEDGDKQRVAKVANRLAELFIEKADTSREIKANETAEFINEELNKVRLRLMEQENRIQAFKSRAAMTLPETMGSSMRMYETAAVQRAGKREEIANDEAQRAALIAELKGLEAQGIQNDKPEAVRTPMHDRLDDLKMQLQMARQRYTDKHPEVLRLQREVRDVERMASMQPATARDPSPIRIRYMQIKAELQAIEQRLASYRTEERRLAAESSAALGRVQAAPQTESQLQALMRDYQTVKEQYQTLLEKQSEAKLAEDLERANKGFIYRITEPARTPSSPFSPQRGRIILLGLFGSIGLGIVLAFFAEQMDTSFGDIDDFQSFTNMPVLTVIPSIHADSGSDKRERATPLRFPQIQAPDTDRGRNLDMKHLKKNHIITLTDTGSVAAEQYGILALKVRQSLGDGKVVALTSSVGGEGKTTTAINMAEALANAGEGRVVLVECDLRKSRIHEYLGFKPTRGLTDLLMNPGEPLEQHIWKVKDLHVIPGGSATLHDPVGMLASHRARDLVARLRQQYDLVVLDCPPILPIADSHILAGLADGVVLVVRARRTRRELFQRAVESFCVPNLMGVVLNDVDYMRSRYAYAYQYYEKHYLEAR